MIFITKNRKSIRKIKKKTYKWNKIALHNHNNKLRNQFQAIAIITILMIIVIIVVIVVQVMSLEDQGKRSNKISKN